MTRSAGLRWLWPTPIGLHRYAGAARLNPQLVGALEEVRAAQQRQRGEEPGPFFASDDDLLQRVKFDGWQDFVGFIVSSIGQIARQANQQAWAGQAFELTVGIEGMWFQCSNGGAFHDVHTHATARGRASTSSRSTNRHGACRIRSMAR
jgi:hypothetical protein